MKTRIETDGNSAVIHVSGRLDSVTAPLFDTQISAAVDSDRDLAIDCSELEYISSAGLRSFITVLKRTKAEGRTLTVSSLSPAIRTIFDMTGFTGIFKIN